MLVRRVVLPLSHADESEHGESAPLEKLQPSRCFFDGVVQLVQAVQFFRCGNQQERRRDEFSPQFDACPWDCCRCIRNQLGLHGWSGMCWCEAAAKPHSPVAIVRQDPP